MLADLGYSVLKSYALGQLQPVPRKAQQDATQPDPPPLRRRTHPRLHLPDRLIDSARPKIAASKRFVSSATN